MTLIHSQDKILSEKLETLDASPAFDLDEENANGASEAALFLDRLNEEELSLDFGDIINDTKLNEEIDNMIQSGTTYQHSRAAGQPYPHGANAYHRQPSYHHSQVSFIWHHYYYRFKSVCLTASVTLRPFSPSSRWYQQEQKQLSKVMPSGFFI